MNISNRIYAYPVLCDENDDYNNLEFNVKFIHEMIDIDNLCLSFSIDMQSKYLDQLILKGLAKYVVHVECSTTSYRTLHRFSSNEFKTTIPISKLNGKVEIVAMIITENNIDDFYSNEWNEIFEHTHFKIRKANIIAYKTLDSLQIIKDYEEFNNANSIFSVFKVDKEDAYMSINLEGQKIKLGLSTKDYNNYIVLSKNETYQAIVNNMVVFPALIFTFEEIQQEDGTKYKDRDWFVSLFNTFTKMGKNFMDELDDKESYQLAQTVMQSPIAKGFEQLKNISISLIEEDEE